MTSCRIFLCSEGALLCLCKLLFIRIYLWKIKHAQISYLQKKKNTLQSVQMCWLLWPELILKLENLWKLPGWNGPRIHFLPFIPMAHYETTTYVFHSVFQATPVRVESFWTLSYTSSMKFLLGKHRVTGCSLPWSYTAIYLQTNFHQYIVWNSPCKSKLCRKACSMKISDMLGSLGLDFYWHKAENSSIRKWYRYIFPSIHSYGAPLSTMCSHFQSYILIAESFLTLFYLSSMEYFIKKTQNKL